MNVWFHNGFEYRHAPEPEAVYPMSPATGRGAFKAAEGTRISATRLPGGELSDLFCVSIGHVGFYLKQFETEFWGGGIVQGRPIIMHLQPAGDGWTLRLYPAERAR